MDIVFLEPTEPRVHPSKSFTLREDGKLDIQSFPNLFHVTSHTVPVDDIQTFAAATEAAARAGFAQLKGRLNRALLNESRKGSTTTGDPTEWVMLDIDGVPGIDDPETLIRACLPPELHEVSYFWQPSASAGIRPGRGFSAHIVMLLSDPIPAPRLRTWLQHVNLDQPRLRPHTALARGNMCLTWPLDITCSQNDKILYICEPTCTNFQPPQLQRFNVVLKTDARLTPNFDGISQALVDARIETRIAELREEAGLPRKKPRYKQHKGGELVLANPDREQVLAVKRERGFTYISFNGDTFPYYHPDKNPLFLYNFKGAPVMLTQDVAPEYWREARETQNAQADNRYFVFRDFLTDRYYNCIWDEENELLEMAESSSKEKLVDFLAQYKLPAPDPIPDWTVGFDPGNPAIVDFEAKTVNRFIRTPYLRHAGALGKGKKLLLPPVCKKVIHHALGGDAECVERFLHWLAYIYQTLNVEKPQTAWIIQGVYGTGKGTLCNDIIRPTLGLDYCAPMRITQFEDQFNEFVINKLLLFVTEARLADCRNPDTAYNQWKTLITDKNHPIRFAMSRGGHRHLDTYCAFIVPSNHHDCVTLPGDDRRFSVAPYQLQKMAFSDAEKRQLSQELLEFTSVMLNWPVNTDYVFHPFENEARSRLIRQTLSAHDEFFKALKDGDLAFFMQELNAVYSDRPQDHEIYKTIVGRWPQYLGQIHKLKKDELFFVFCYLQNEKVKVNRFNKILARQGITIAHPMIDGKQHAAIPTVWRTPESEISAILGRPPLKAVK